MQQTPFNYLTAYDGLVLRYGEWPGVTANGCGTVVLLTGRTEFMEKYLDVVYGLNHRGFDVYSLDWRGQGRSGRMLTNPRKGYVASYQDYLADLEQFMRTVVLARSQTPVIFLAHSMGGAIALLYLHRNSQTIDKAILASPLLRINASRPAEISARLMSRWMTRLGMGHVAVPAPRRRHSFFGPFENNGLTSDPVRFKAIQRMIDGDPQLAVSCVTYGWLSATFDALDMIQHDGFASRITARLLFAVAENDPVVCNDAIYRFAKTLLQARTAMIRGAYHEILQEKKNIRLQFWQAFDAFVHDP